MRVTVCEMNNQPVRFEQDWKAVCDHVKSAASDVEDAANRSFEDADFDLAVSQNVFHHMAKWQTAVREIARVLEPDGFMLWLDLAFPRWIAQRFQSLAKHHGLHYISEAKTVFKHQVFEQLFHSSRMHGLCSQHYIVWQKKG